MTQLQTNTPPAEASRFPIGLGIGPARRKNIDWLLRGDKNRTADVADGSIAYFRWPEQQTFDRSSMGPVTRRVREGLQSHVNQPLAPSAPPSRPGER